MPNRQTRHDRKKRRQELIDQAMHDREVRGAGPELTGPQGVGAPRATGSDTPATEPLTRSPKRRLPE
jgi:hypothetical protein